MLLSLQLLYLLPCRRAYREQLWACINCLSLSTFRIIFFSMFGLFSDQPFLVPDYHRRRGCNSGTFLRSLHRFGRKGFLSVLRTKMFSGHLVSSLESHLSVSNAGREVILNSIIILSELIRFSSKCRPRYLLLSLCRVDPRFLQDLFGLHSLLAHRIPGSGPGFDVTDLFLC
jgi:hypothetical protein